MKKNNLYRLITSELKRYEDKKHAFSNKKYHKYKGHKSLGIKAPILDRLLKGFGSEIKKLSCGEALLLAKKLYITRIEEYILAGNYILQLRNDCLGVKQLPYLDRNLDCFVSWSTTDDFCIDVLQPVLLRHPKETVRLMRKWNKSKKIWKRRASMVAFVRKVGESGKFTDSVLELCDSLIGDKEDLVKKGVGWALKDNLRGNKVKVMAYIKKLRKEGASSTIILYAIRDLRSKERNEILHI